MRHHRSFAAGLLALSLAGPAAAAPQQQTAPPPPPRSRFAPPLDLASPPADAQKTSSGLVSKVLRPGTGRQHPSPADVITTHYVGWTADGKMFDTSYARPTPLAVQLKGLLPGWVEGLQLMVEGEQRRFWIPEALAYKGMEGKPEGMLVFDIELLDIASLAAPPDVAKPPSDALRRPSGLASKVLRPGTGKTMPRRSSTVVVHYTGWTTDGAMFDSSLVRGDPLPFSLDAVIEGWTEGVQLMVVGEKRRLWIPESLAYQGRPGRPAGMLVFDIELIAIQ